MGAGCCQDPLLPAQGPPAQHQGSGLGIGAAPAPRQQNRLPSCTGLLLPESSRAVCGSAEAARHVLAGLAPRLDALCCHVRRSAPPPLPAGPQQSCSIHFQPGRLTGDGDLRPVPAEPGFTASGTQPAVSSWSWTSSAFSPLSVTSASGSLPVQAAAQGPGRARSPGTGANTDPTEMNSTAPQASHFQARNKKPLVPYQEIFNQFLLFTV